MTDFIDYIILDPFLHYVIVVSVACAMAGVARLKIAEKYRVVK